ncbi:MAG TPA: peptidase S15 [Acidimicrobiaceae bacterium]|nr:peptidase S15 [Acidimicrobiaceae bacterium]
MRSPRLAPLFIAAVLLAACSDDGGGASDATQGTTETSASTSTDAPTTDPGGPELPMADWTVMPGTEQVAILEADEGTAVQLVAAGPDGTVAAEGQVDEQGALLFRSVTPGDYHLQSADVRTDTFTVADPADAPDPATYEPANQPLFPAEGGFGYITTRDGTTLSANVILPGPVEGGPYPTVVEYSGYQPSDPDSAALAALYTSQGFAYVGVNMRGTGCSGGSFRFFETVQSLDGYDVIEAVAAQPWVQGNKVGMVGISYPGISQLFVAATQPPSLAAITPLSVIDDSYRATLYPGGILNTGFAVEWTAARVRESQPYGQGWTTARADGGDVECADNQRLRLQNPDLVAEIDVNPFYDTSSGAELGDSLAPITFADRITVPIMLAGAWQDEQTGAHFAAMLPEFTNSPHVYIDLVNGLHTEALAPRSLARTMEFLQLYVAEKVPSIEFANGLGPVLGGAIWGVGTFAPFEDRFAGMSYEEALAAFEAEPPVRVHMEQGGNDDFAAGTPEPSFTLEFSAWPIPEAEAQTWRLADGGALLPAADNPAPTGESTYTADPAALPATFYEGDGNGVWRADVAYQWQPLPDGSGVGFVTAPLADDTVVIGPGSVDLWITSSAPDTDLEVTLTEVRPDGTEIYVQSGWLRASHRQLDEAASTDLRPVHTHLEGDAAPLPSGEATPVRIELFPVAHVFRAGSQLRLTIDAPGNNRSIWEFRTISGGETVTIVHDADHPSQVVLSVVPGITVPVPAPPACGALRGQPCRPYEPASNGG